MTLRAKTHVDTAIISVKATCCSNPMAGYFCDRKTVGATDAAHTAKMEKKYILTGPQASMKLRRMAFEILENNPGEEHLILVGIRDSGYTVARRLQALLADISPLRVTLVSLTIDKRRPAATLLEPDTPVDGEVVILVDDVANSGRTLLYALKPFLDRYPRKIQTLVLVERSHKTYPIHPDYVGHRLATTLSDNVVVEVQDGEILGAYLD